MRILLFLFLFAIPCYSQTSITFDTKSSTKAVVSADCSVTYSTWSIKATIKGDDLTLYRPYTNYPIYTKQTGDRFDIGLIFATKPTTDYFEFKIPEYQNYDFNQIVPFLDRQGKPAVISDEVLGGFSICSKSNEIGKTGQKAFIYRAKMIGKNNEIAYGTMTFVNGVLAVRIPRDNVTYPAVLDPTLGVTSIGSAEDYTNNGYLIAMKAGFMPEDGTLASISIAAWQSDGNGHVKLALFYDNTTTPGTPYSLVPNAYTGEVIVTRTTKPTQSSEWTTGTISGGASLTKDTTYWIQIQSPVETNKTYYAYNSAVGSGLYKYITNEGYATFPNNPSTAVSESGTERDSVYITYTTGGGSTGKTPQEKRR